MSSSVVSADLPWPDGAHEPPRRRLTSRQARTVDRLCVAAIDEIRASGYDGLTVRNVARRAGVAPATAYTYFASKDHLVAEVFWRRLRTIEPASVDRRRSAAARAATALRELALLVVDEPELAAACTAALLAPDADVKHLRERIGAEVQQRLSAALGDSLTPPVLRALELAFTGAMVQAGTGHLAYTDLPDRLAEVAGLVLGERR